MSTITIDTLINYTPPKTFTKTKRIESIDLLRGTVMIIMALDHVRDYFHYDAFHYDPTDLTHTNIFPFLTRWITHYCAPIFIFLAGISAHLYGAKRSKKELFVFLLTRGIWLALAEMGIITLIQTFNPSYPVFNLQVIWAIGISMIFLSLLVLTNKRFILVTAILMIFGHNLLDTIHVPGTGGLSFAWALVHEVGHFTFGRSSFYVHYPVVPWIGLMALGYCFGSLYVQGYDAEKRRRVLLYIGTVAIALFIILRCSNIYGDPSHWSVQKNIAFTLLSFLNVTKYPPSLLYILMTVGPALIFLSLTENLQNQWTSRITIFGRVAMFYYIVHFFLIHLFAVFGAMILGHSWTDMILSVSVNASPQLKDYGFNLAIVYAAWLGLIIVLYPLCKRFDIYKRANLAEHWWLSYL